MREIVLDTETTGLDPKTGDRLVEIGGVELINHIPTGNVYHQYINPERDMPEEAFRVHGLSAEFLSDKPVFADVARAFVDFAAGAKLVIHNAAFDMGFINHELRGHGYDPIGNEHVIDTLMMARRKHPAGPNSLDALCSRYGIDNSKRTRHGALLDAELLAEVYIELLGGKQSNLGFGDDGAASRSASTGPVGLQSGARAKQRPAPLPSRLSDGEREAHQAFVESLGDNALWHKYGS
ncbi:DNA polymerase III subunit epsilon [Coralliovum pocilloporae]|uniref:DNA polymerase III subunit epsilon n=1 Tax=Coralliovum pocilloporae TaxID=3066369 RepID=UPI0033073C9D